MTVDPAHPYQIELFPSARTRIKRCAQEAVRRGLANEYAAALRAIQERPRTLPLPWGDPANYLDGMKLWKYKRLFDRLFVVYYVHEEERIVFIEDIRPVLGHPLESANES
jgi:hypothetical protein